VLGLVLVDKYLGGEDGRETVGRCAKAADADA